MDLDNLNIDFDVNEIIDSIKDFLFKTVRIIFVMFFNLPMWIKITLAVFFTLGIIGIGYLTWKYRYEWQHVKH